MKLLSVCLWTFLAITSCENAAIDQKETPAKVLANVSYGNSPQQTMDIYLPENANKASTKLLVLLHGGGWMGGDKSELNFFIDSMKKYFPDMAFANINYRLATNTGENKFPTQEMDVQDALNFLTSKRSEYGISENWGIVGASAGAHLAMLSAYKKRINPNFKIVGNYFGPSDLVQLYNNPNLTMFRQTMVLVAGGTPDTNPAIYESSSPTNFIIKNETPPTITFQGGADPLVPESQQRELHKLLDEKGVANELYLYPGEFHGFNPIVTSETIQKLVSFMKKYF